MIVQHEISLGNIGGILGYAAQGHGVRLRSQENDRWLTQIGPSSYCSSYDPYFGRLSTIWHIVPNLVMWMGRASVQESLLFPIRLSPGEIALLIGTRFSFRMAGDNAVPPHRGAQSCRLIAIKSEKEIDLSIELLPGETSFFFGVLGKTEAALPGFPPIGKFVEHICLPESGNHEGQFSERELPYHFGDIITEMLNGPLDEDLHGAYITAKAIELLVKTHRHSNMGKLVPDSNSVVSFVRNNLDNDPARQITLCEFSKHFGASERSLHRKFKEETGLTFGTYQRKRRMEKAARLLMDGSTEIRKIAEACGYYSITAFYKAFKSEFGVPPDRYKKRMDCHLQ